MLTITPDSGVEKLAKDYEDSVKSTKFTIYKLAWYLRGGVDAHKLMNDTDLEDIEIINKVVEENIDSTKKTGMPLI